MSLGNVKLSTTGVSLDPPPINKLISNEFVTTSVAAAKSVNKVLEPFVLVSRYIVRLPEICLAPVNDPIGLSTIPNVSGVTYVTLFAIVIEPPVMLISYVVVESLADGSRTPLEFFVADNVRVESLFLK